jgi:ligand-binding sensor domain-containing protein/C4-dicarboxylate-specific signal transduction histidine kinase
MEYSSEEIMELRTKKSRKSSARLLILFVLVFHLSLYAQKENLRFEHISLQEGLPQSVVYCILQDKIGFMWFCTEDGLTRYDGYNFKEYKHVPGDSTTISDNFTWSILEDNDGILWIGTLSGGLNRFDPAKEQFTSYQHQHQDTASLGHNEVRCIYQDKSGKLWVGTNGGGLNRFDKTAGTFKRYTHSPNAPGSLSHNDIRCIYQDRTGNLWVGTRDGGLNRLMEPSTGRFKTYLHSPNNKTGLSHNDVRCIHEDRSGRMWIGTGAGGLNRLMDKEKGTFEHFKNQPGNPNSLISNTIWFIYEDPLGILWLGTDKGLTKFNPDEKIFTCFSHDPAVPFSLSRNDLRTIYEDRFGILWIGTYGGGLNKFVPGKQVFKLYAREPGNEKSLSNNTVWDFSEDKTGGIWIGTEEGINRFDQKTAQITRYKHNPLRADSLSHDNARAIHVDQAGNTWIGTIGGGLNKLLDSTIGRFRRYRHDPSREDSLSDDSIYFITGDRNGALWIGTENGGINILKDTGKDRFIHIKHDEKNPNSLSHNHVRCIYEDTGGVIWIGTWGDGLNRFDGENNRFTHYRYDPANPYSLCSNRVRCIYEDKQGALWLGTDGGGLDKLLDWKTGRFKHYTKYNGLPNNVVFGILEDKQGNLWLSTIKGLSKFDPQEEIFRNFDADDGLQSNEFNANAYFKDQTGKMFFGGINGFNIFDPGEISDDPNPPPIVITDLLILNKSVSPKNSQNGSPLKKAIYNTQEITLSYKQNVFSFEFAALHWASPAKNRYAYQLHGWDKEWIDTDSKNRRATYMNLPDGEYTFQVKGSNKDDQWNHEGVSIKIKILPPWWKTWWAYTLYVLAAAVLVFWVIYINRKLEKKVKERTHDLEQQKEVLEKINTIVKSINTQMRFTDLLHVILKEIMIIKGVEKASALIWDPEAQQFTFKAAIGRDMHQLERIKLTRGEAVELYLKDAEKIYDDIFISRNISEESHNKKLAHLQIPKAMLVICIKIEKETHAYLIFDNMHDENAFDEDDIFILNNLKEHFSAAIQKNGLIARLEQINRRLQSTQDQLVQAQKMVSLGMLVSGVGHELNNPANLIKMDVDYFSQVWKEIIYILDQYAMSSNNELEITGLPYHELKQEMEKMLKAISDGSLRIQNLIAELRAFTRKTDSSHQQECDMNKIIQSAINLTNGMLKKATNHFTCELGEGLPSIYGNYQRLEQVVINLLQNAVQALLDTSRGINISTTYDEVNKQIVCKVKDEGVGIEKQNMEHITEPFFSTKTNFGGIGLGLSISNQIIREHGGTLKFESTPGKGTTVSIHLPVKTKDVKK